MSDDPGSTNSDQRWWILAHFTAEVLFAHKARVALWCGATTSGPQRRERTRDRGLRWGKTARRVRRSACPHAKFRLDIARRTAPARAGRFAAMR